MAILSNIGHAFATCNLHFCFYSLLGALAAHRAWGCAEPHQREERHEHLVHALLYFLLGLL